MSANQIGQNVSVAFGSTAAGGSTFKKSHVPTKKAFTTRKTPMWKIIHRLRR